MNPLTSFPASSRFRRAYPPQEPGPAAAASLWLPFMGHRLLVRDRGAGGPVTLLRADEIEILRDVLPPGDAAAGGPPERLFLGTLDDVPCIACALDPAAADTPPPGTRAVDLRTLWGLLDDDAQYALAGYASQLLHGQRLGRYCGACGGPTVPKPGDWGRQCADCGHTAYPPVHPAVLILVHDGGDRVLLAHKPGWGKRYSILAGFVEPGESLEQCVVRETEEEVGVAVTDLVYVGSQPWPFPSQLMIGFTARCAASADGDDACLRLDEQELDHAAWFRADDLPELPPPLSLSRQIIDAWAGGVTG